MSDETHGSINIPRVAKTKLSELPIDETNNKIFVGVKNPQISKVYVTGGVLPLKALCKIACSLERSKVTEFKLIKDSLAKNHVPGYKGYCQSRKHYPSRVPSICEHLRLLLNAIDSS